MSQIYIYTEEYYRKRGYIDESWLSGIERRFITADEVYDALNLAAQPGPRREFVVVAERPARRSGVCKGF